MSVKLDFSKTSGFELFQQKFGTSPDWVSTAPGRVNLIGEHTDYNLLPVLPMTIDRSIRIYGQSRSDGIVRLINACSSHDVKQFDLDGDLRSVSGDWANYVRAALIPIQAEIREKGLQPRGFDAIVESDLPSAAGLSSSSALVIASCLAGLEANKLEWSMPEIADRMRRAERFVGTAGGGMDQAAISLGQQDSALLIEFDPLAVTPVSVPGSIAVFIINTGQKAEKTGAARFGYNRRALECAVAVQLMKCKAASAVETSGWATLRDVYRTCTEAGIPWNALLTRYLPVDPMSFDRAVELVGIDSMTELCTDRKLDINHVSDWLPENCLQLFARASHVLNEANRVYEFQHALETDVPESIYQLARASHASCRDLYHISTPEIESLIFTAIQCGAGAGRITGAGFGGCIVAFVPDVESGEFMERLISTGVPQGNVLRAISVGPAHITTFD